MRQLSLAQRQQGFRIRNENSRLHLIFLGLKETSIRERSFFSGPDGSRCNAHAFNLSSWNCPAAISGRKSCASSCSDLPSLTTKEISSFGPAKRACLSATTSRSRWWGTTIPPKFMTATSYSTTPRLSSGKFSSVAQALTQPILSQSRPAFIMAVRVNNSW